MRDLYGALEGGGSKFLCALGTGPDDVRDTLRIETTDPDSTLARIVAYFAPHRTRLRALGVSCFGPLELDPRRGEQLGSFLRTPKPGWSGFPLRARLAAELGLPVAIDTDVNGAALAEQRWGALRAADPAVYITVGTGVGVGVVIGGQPLHGLMHPELGHLRVAGAQHAGSCSFHGACVEGLASAPAIRARTGSAPDQLADDHAVWAEVANALGQLLCAIVLAYSPERIVLAGGVLERPGLRAAASAALVAQLGGYVPRRQLEPAHIAQYVVGPALGARSGLLGGLWLALNAGA
ncbi:MAG TPA: ROK family protein [Polyangiales bacterium]